MTKTSHGGYVCRNFARRIAGATGLAVILICAGSIPFASAVCPNEGRTPSRLGLQEIHDSLACLINQERALNGLSPLAIDGSLHRAAKKHSKTMNRKNFFAHRGLNGRVRQAGYCRGAYSWRLGEVIGWGNGSPRWLVSSWMRSPTHREVLLVPGFLEMGIGVVRGSPLSRKRRPGIAAYTVDFGYRNWR